MSIRTPARKGELYILAEALLWSLFPVVTILTFTNVSPLFSAALNTLISSLFFALVLSVKRGWGQFFKNPPWKEILVSSLFIGVIMYAFFFVGLRHTTAGNAAIVGLMEVFFSFFILGVCIKHERVIPSQLLGGVCMVAGALFILLPKASGWHSGDLLVLAGAAFPPIGNMFAQRARARVSGEFILFARSIVSGLFLLLLAFIFEPVPDMQRMAAAWEFLFLNGLILFGVSKILWIEGIRLIPITKAISLASIGPLFTLIFAYFILSERVTVYQVAGFVPIAVGIYFLTRTKGNVIA